MPFSLYFVTNYINAPQRQIYFSCLLRKCKRRRQGSPRQSLRMRVLLFIEIPIVVRSGVLRLISMHVPLDLLNSDDVLRKHSLGSSHVTSLGCAH
jgi:hypothetical protein